MLACEQSSLLTFSHHKHTSECCQLHCPYTVLSLVLNVLTVHFKQVLLVQTGALSLNSYSGQSSGAASNLSFHTISWSTFLNFDWQFDCLHRCGMQSTLLSFILQIPSGGVSESQPAASAVLPQRLYSTSTCGSADRLDKAGILKVWTFIVHIWEGLPWVQ